MKDKVKKYEKEIVDRNEKLQNCKVNMEEKDAIIRSLEAKNAQELAHTNNLQSQIVKRQTEIVQENNNEYIGRKRKDGKTNQRFRVQNSNKSKSTQRNAAERIYHQVKEY